MAAQGPLVPARRTVTEVRKLSFQELLGHLRIPNGDLTEIHISVETPVVTREAGVGIRSRKQTEGTVTIVTKTEEDIA